MTSRAQWNGRLVADSDDDIVVEGQHYFPIESVTPGVLEPSRTHSLCLWKGIASYYDVVVDGVRCPDGAWQYRHPTPLARRVKHRVAFWNGVEVSHGPSAVH